MVTYAIGVLPMIKRLKWEYTDVTQTCYVEYGGALGTYKNIVLYFNFLKKSDLGSGYYSSPSKRVLIVHPDNIVARKEFDLSHGFKVCTGIHYLGGFIEDDNYNIDWLKYCTLNWEKNIITIRKTADKYPQ